MVHLALDRPPASDRPPRFRFALAGAVVVGLAAAFAGGFWVGRTTAPGAARDGAAPEVAAVPPPAAPSAPAEQPAPAAALPAPGAEALPAPGAEALPAPGAAAPALPGAPAAPPAPAAAPYRRAVVTLAGPLEGSIASALSPADRGSAEELSAVVNRLLVWDLHVRSDARKGDRLEILWSPPVAAAPGLPATGEPVVEAVRYASSKLGAVVAAYRFQPEGARWPRHYRADGTEVESRLLDGPIGEYEQVTSLLRDGRRHKGVDFKTPVGTPVLAPFDGVIVRRNWNFAGNGNCLDVRDPATGRHAIFLHLDVVPKEMAVGRKVRKGEVIAASGNSGRSYAPHLHYQLEDASGRVLDPYAIHRTERRALAARDRAAYDAARARLEALLKG